MSLEDYLEQIFLLQKVNNNVRVTDIAEALQISKPSVNRAINTLKEEGYLSHEHYGTIVLTEVGSKVAENILETHRLLKKFLVECLGVEEDTAEKEACLMEHAISKSTKNKLKIYMKKALKDN
jgi:Mn-dependent DtxR family transcriptional regulator